MKQAILTKHLAPTDFKGARIKAQCERGSVTIPYDHALNPDENHFAAAQECAKKFGLNYSNMSAGWLFAGSGWEYVFLPAYSED